MIDWNPLLLTFKLAAITTVILFFVSIPLAYWLAGTKTKFKPAIEALVSMPIVLPPTVIGFYMLIIFSPANQIGKFLQDFVGLQLVFSFEGLVFASVLYSLPFMVHPIQSGFSNLPNRLSEAAYLMGKSKMETLLRVLLPNIKPALLTGIVLSFAHTIGEFGVVLMIGGNIPRKTKVASIEIYDKVESLQYGEAGVYSLILFVITFSILLMVYWVNKRSLKSLLND